MSLDVRVGDWVRYRIPNFDSGLERIEIVTQVETLCVYIEARKYWICKADILEVRHKDKEQP